MPTRSAQVTGAQPIGPELVRARLEEVYRRIESAGGDPAATRIVAVTKGFGPDAPAAAAAAGLSDVGENYAQELLAKASALRGQGVDDLRWHFVGTVQRNKVRALAPAVACWQSLARAVEADAIARWGPGARILIEVETTGRPGRNGCRPSEVELLAAHARDLGLEVTGLMTVAPHEPGAARTSFRTIRSLADRLELPERSMGMTDDLEAAVAEGATMVRVGRGLFGDRPLARQGVPPIGG